MLKIYFFIFLIAYSCAVFAHGEVHDRIVLATDEINASPNDPLLYVKRANLYLEDGDYDETILDIYQAIEIGGEHFAPVKMLTAQMYFKLGMNEIALKHINQFLVLEQDHVIGLITKAKILVAMNEPEQAAEYFQLAIEKTTTLLPENFMDLVNVFIESNQLELALQYCELAQFKFGRLLIFDLKAIEIAKQKEDYTMVLQILDQIIEMQPRKERFYFQKAEIYQLLNDSKQVERHLNLAEVSLDALPQRIKLTPAMKELLENINSLRMTSMSTQSEILETNLIKTH